MVPKSAPQHAQDSGDAQHAHTHTCSGERTLSGSPETDSTGFQYKSVHEANNECHRQMQGQIDQRAGTHALTSVLEGPTTADVDPDELHSAGARADPRLASSSQSTATSNSAGILAAVRTAGRTVPRSICARGSRRRGGARGPRRGRVLYVAAHRPAQSPMHHHRSAVQLSAVRMPVCAQVELAPK